MPHLPARAASVTAGGLLALTTLIGCSSPGSSGSQAGGADRPVAGAVAGAQAGPKVVHITVTASGGCTVDAASFAAGGATFRVANKDATAVSEVEVLSGERIIGEKENVPPGFGGEFAVDVPAGAYTLYCPGATPERTPLKATGTAAVSSSGVTALLAQATKGYANYVTTQLAALLVAAGKLNTALHGRSLAAAQVAYTRARPYYEKIEPVAESFVIGTDSLDKDLDARVNDVPASRWRGFHRIEQALFAHRSLADLQPYGDKLVADVHRLQKLSSGLHYQATELANGATALLDEVAAHKITGEEERYSHIDLLDFADNAEAANQAFAQLQPALDRIDALLSRTVAARFTALHKALAAYRTTANPSGYRLYPTLTAADKRLLAAAVKSVQEPLSTVASKIANA